MTKDEVVYEITKRAWALGVSILLSPDSHVYAEKNVPCSGYFDSEATPPQIVVATGQCEDKWLGILVHEYCHAEQWVEQCNAWVDADKAGDWHVVFDGKPVRDLKKKAALARELEADNERRTIRLLKQLRAPVDIEKYIRAANAYLHFYNLIPETKKWFAKEKGPYQIPEVLIEANATLDKDFSKTPAKLRKAILKYCYD